MLKMFFKAVWMTKNLKTDKRIDRSSKKNYIKVSIMTFDLSPILTKIQRVYKIKILNIYGNLYVVFGNLYMYDLIFRSRIYVYRKAYRHMFASTMAKNNDFFNIWAILLQNQKWYSLYFFLIGLFRKSYADFFDDLSIQYNAHFKYQSSKYFFEEVTKFYKLEIGLNFSKI